MRRFPRRRIPLPGRRPCLPTAAPKTDVVFPSSLVQRQRQPHHFVGTITASVPEESPITRTRTSWQCWINPWSDLAVLIPPAELSQRVFAYTQLWGVLSTLMCTASVTTLLGFPHVPDSQQHQDVANEPPGRPLLSILIPPTRLHDFYIATSVLSFFSGGIALGVATVTNITGFLIPSQFIGNFVKRHSLLLGSLPGLTVISGGLLGMSVVSGVDMEDRGGPLSKVAVYGYIVATMIITATSFSGHAALVRGIARAKQRTVMTSRISSR